MYHNHKLRGEVFLYVFSLLCRRYFRGNGNKAFCAFDVLIHVGKKHSPSAHSKTLSYNFSINIIKKVLISIRQQRQGGQAQRRLMNETLIISLRPLSVTSF